MAQHTCDGHRKTLECLLSRPHTGSWGQANRLLPAHPPHWPHNQFLVSFLNKYLLLAWGGGQHAKMHMWRLEENSVGLSLHFYMSPQDQVASLAWQVSTHRASSPVPAS